MEQFAGGAINGSNVVNIEGVAHAEAVGEQSGANANRDSLMGRTRCLKQQGKAKEVEEGNHTCHESNLTPVTSRPRRGGWRREIFGQGHSFILPVPTGKFGQGVH
jgi:hypothetical protein